jgi:hypothetical protein
MVYESDRIRDAEFAHYGRIRQTGDIDENARALAQFLSISPAAARDIAAFDHLFAD